MRHFKLLFLFSLIFILVSTLGKNCYAQKKNVKVDSIAVKKHSAKKATYLALVPGLGQIYNKKYWKLPIVYAGFGASAYFAFSYRKEYLTYNEAYTCLLIAENEGTECTNDLAQKYTSDELKSAKDWYRRNMELSYIVMGAWYILQILDASVDANLYYWEVNEDLQVNIEPVAQPIMRSFSPVPLGQDLPYNGIKIRVKF